MAGNPLINNMTKPAGDPRFGQFGAGGTTTANPYGQQPQSPYGTYQQGNYQQGSYSQQAPYGYENQQVSAGQLNDMYNAGTAGPVDTKRHHHEDRPEPGPGCSGCCTRLVHAHPHVRRFHRRPGAGLR